MSNQIYCAACMRNRDRDQFKGWLTNKFEARRCDSCKDDPEVRKRVERCKAERDVKPGATSDTPQLVGLSKTEIAKGKCEVRNSIADIKAQREIDDFVGD